MTLTIRIPEQAALETIRDRAYHLMYLAEQKYGHSSAAHSVAWTVFVDASVVLAGDEVSVAYADEAEMSHALDVVAKAVGPRGRQRVELLELARRPHSMGPVQP